MIDVELSRLEKLGTEVGHCTFCSMAPAAKYLTGDREGIKEFIHRFDVSS